MRAGLVVAAVMVAAVPLAGQTPDSTATPGVGSCVLEWGAPPTGRAPALRHTEDESGQVADFFSGRTLFTCGTATMLADSAVSYETRGEVVLVGNVAYQDSLRSLDSSYLTYYKLIDLVVADEDVRLVRTADRSMLEGPHVEFLRAVSGVDELTIATGRPHMTLFPEGEEPGPPFEVDADRTVFAGEDEARAYGNVVIDREDLHGEADSVRLRRTDETGEMWGDPWIEAENVRLEGDEIDFRSRDDVLEEVHSRGEGRAVGESFEVLAMIIDIRLVDEQPDRVWAHGPGLSRALSGEHNVYGDSLEFAMFEGAIDTLYAVGDAMALSGDGGVPAGTPGAVSPDTGARAAPADSTGAAPAPSVTEAPGLPPGLEALAAAADSPGVRLDSIPTTVLDSAAVSGALETLAGVAGDSVSAVVRDSLAAAVVRDSLAAAVVGDSLAAAVVGDSLATAVVGDSLAAVEGDSLAAGAGDTPATRIDSLVTLAGDSTAARASAETSDAAAGSVAAPRLRIEGDATWIRGDTVIAVFERPVPDSASTTAAVPATPTPAVPPSPVSPDTARTVAEAALPPVDSLIVVEPEEAAADTAADPVMEKLIAIGNARSLFSQVRDSTVSRRESKNYMIGKRIEVLFEDGEPAHVYGVEAIGVFLDPVEPGAPGAGARPVSPTGAADSARIAPDTLAVGRDTLAVPPDTLAVPRDTLAVPPDTLAAPRDTVAARRERGWRR